MRPATETAKAKGTWTDPSLGKVLFRDWLGEWWATTTNVRPKTRDRDELLLRRLALPSFGAVPLAAISQRDVRAWVAELSARGLAPATVQKSYQLLGKVMGAAVDAGMLAQSPCRRVPLPKVEREEMRFLTPAEVATLADAIAPRCRALVLVGAYGGLRIGELAGLRRSRVDLLPGRSRWPRSSWRFAGCCMSGRPRLGPAGARWACPGSWSRSWPPTWLARATRRRLCSPRRRVARCESPRSGFGCGGRRPGGRPGRAAHPDLRHTAVALWIAAGASPKEVSARAGHASVSFTLDRYGHLYPEADAALRDRLDALYGSTQPAPAPRVIRLPERPGRGPSVAPGASDNDKSAADGDSATL